MLDYSRLALAASLLLAPVAAAPYVTPNAEPVPVPKLTKSKAQPNYNPQSPVLTSPNPNFGLTTGNKAYSLVTTYNSGNWMNSFQVQNIADPTDGFVTYVDQSQAESDGLYQIRGDQVYVGVDHTTVLNPNGAGRNSVRLMSNEAYTHGIIIGDFAHIPGTECGSWPAL